MRWKFWNKDSSSNDKRETVLKTTQVCRDLHSEYYVQAQSPKEALDLMKKLRERK